MSNGEKYVTASTMTTAKAPTLEEIQATMNRLTFDQLSALSRFVSGIKVIPDDSGMMCGPNEYVVWMGRKLYDKLKVHIDEQNKPLFIKQDEAEHE